MVSVFWMVFAMDAWIVSIALVVLAVFISWRGRTESADRDESWDSIMAIQEVLR